MLHEVAREADGRAEANPVDGGHRRVAATQRAYSLDSAAGWAGCAPQAGILFDLVRLQRQQSVWRFSSVERPPLDTGMMWSTSSSR